MKILILRTSCRPALWVPCGWELLVFSFKHSECSSGFFTYLWGNIIGILLGILFYLGDKCRHIGSGFGKLFLREVVRGVCFRVPAIIVKHLIVCFLFQYRQVHATCDWQDHDYLMKKSSGFGMLSEFASLQETCQPWKARVGELQIPREIKGCNGCTWGFLGYWGQLWARLRSNNKSIRCFGSHQRRGLSYDCIRSQVETSRI